VSGRGQANGEYDDEQATRLKQELANVWPLLGRHIAFHRRLVDLTANVKAALLLSQTIYWTRHGRDIEQRDGWFYKTSEQWEMETGLSAKEQCTARLVLRELTILSERRIGLPAKLHFRLAVDRLGALLAERIGRAWSQRDWADGAAVAELLGPPLSFHRKLAALAGGVNAGLLLSRALYLTRGQSSRRIAAWISRSIPRWTEELGLTRREMETARRDLLQTGVWEEDVTGMPPRLAFRVRLDDLLTLLCKPIGIHAVPAPDVSEPGHPGCGIAASSDAQNGETRMREFHSLDSPKAPQLFHQNRHDCFAETAMPHIERSTQGLLQPLRGGHDADAPAGCGGDLVFPDSLLPEERARALTLVSSLPDSAQALLDELSARMEARGVHKSPLAYLRALVSRAQAGTFVPELGLRVAAARRQRDAEAVLLQQRQAEERRLTQERARPEYQANIAARREEIRRLFGPRPARRPEGKTR